MSIKTVTNFRVLLRLARTAAEARKSGTSAKIELAEKEHKAYEQLCLTSDIMTI